MVYGSRDAGTRPFPVDCAESNLRRTGIPPGGDSQRRHAVPSATLAVDRPDCGRRCQGLARYAAEGGGVNAVAWRGCVWSGPTWALVWQGTFGR